MRLTTLLILTIMTTKLASQSFSNISYDAWSGDMHTLLLDTLEVSYWEKGEGPTLFLIHGVPTSSWLYRHMAEDLVDKGFRVIIPDMMGFGLSDRSTNEEILGFKGQASCIDGIYKSLKGEENFFIVHDAGGPWTWQWLTTYDAKLDGVVVLNTILYLDGFDPPMNLRSGSIGHGLLKWAYTRKSIGKSIVRSTLKKGIEDRKLSKEEKFGYTEPMSHEAGLAISVFFGSFDALKEITSKAQAYLKDSQIPLCAIWGKEDPFLLSDKQLPFAMSELNLKKRHTHILSNCSHFIQEEAPADICRLVESFIQDVRK